MSCFQPSCDIRSCVVLVINENQKILRLGWYSSFSLSTLCIEAFHRKTVGVMIACISGYSSNQAINLTAQYLPKNKLLTRLFAVGDCVIILNWNSVYVNINSFSKLRVASEWKFWSNHY